MNRMTCRLLWGWAVAVAACTGQTATEKLIPERERSTAATTRTPTDVNVVNTAGNPVPTIAQGTTDVSGSTVALAAGTGVSVESLPAVTGTVSLSPVTSVDIGTLPTVSANVSGSVGINTLAAQLSAGIQPVTVPPSASNPSGANVFPDPFAGKTAQVVIDGASQPFAASGQYVLNPGITDTGYIVDVVGHTFFPSNRQLQINAISGRISLPTGQHVTDVEFRSYMRHASDQALGNITLYPNVSPMAVNAGGLDIYTFSLTGSKLAYADWFDPQLFSNLSIIQAKFARDSGAAEMFVSYTVTGNLVP
jgi:hypothetical protein